MRKIFRLIFSRLPLVMAVMLVSLVFSGASLAAEHASLYAYGQTVSYCSQTPCTGAGNCEEDRYPCGGDFSYKYTDKLAGFKDLYNLNDAKILCGQDLLDSSSCAPEEKSLSLSLATLRQKGIDYVSSFPDAFRIFIPPGTVYGYVNIYMPIDGQEGVVVRYQQPPDGVYCQFSDQPSHYDDVPWDVPNQVSLNTMKQRDVYLRNWGGLAAAVSPFSLRIPLSSSGSGWLYIRKLPFTSSRIHKISASFRVDVAAFRNWYDGVVWDAGGDPWSANNNVASTRVCSSSNLDACLTESACERVGAHWYDGSCNAQAACTENNLYACNSQDKCDSAGFYWYNNSCNPEVACTGDNLLACATESECEGSGFYWYDGACNAESRCRINNPEGCESQNDCLGVGAYWYDGSCNAEAACTAGNLGDCNTEQKCEGSGFYWYDGMCSAESACSQDNLAGCTNRTACQANGGVWYTTGGCKSPATSTTSYSSPLPSSSGSASSGLAALFGFSGSTPQPQPTITAPAATSTCDSDHLDVCDKEGCEALGDGYWHDGEVCRKGRETRDYSDNIPEAFFRLGEDVNDGELTNGEEVALELYFNAQEAVHYAMIVFPDDEYFFIQSDNVHQLFSKLPVPARNAGTLLAATDLCAALPEYQGEWKIYLLTVPAGRGFDDPEVLSAYLGTEDAQYVFGSYSIHVDCNARNNRNIASMFMGF